LSPTVRGDRGTVGGFSLVDAGATFVVASVGGILLGIAIGAVTAWAVGRVNDPVFSSSSRSSRRWSRTSPRRTRGSRSRRPVDRRRRHLPRPEGAAAHELRGPRLRVAAWQILLFLINGSVFILIGLQLPTSPLRARLVQRPQLLGLAVAVSLTVIVARIVWVFPATYVPRMMSAKIRDARSGAVQAERRADRLGGDARRGLAGAALALPLDFPFRNLVIFLTFTVILATLVGQG
jgi:CPA1 family monovalent cation:H+ antiporter